MINGPNKWFCYILISFLDLPLLLALLKILPDSLTSFFNYI